jgi:hypothetical protein
MTPVEEFLYLLGQQGQLRPQRKRSIYHYDFPAASAACFKTIRSDNQIRLHTILVETPQQGAGTELMTMICSIADHCNVSIELTALPFGVLSQKISMSKLITWYRGFRFVVNDDFYEDQTVDIVEGLEMIRDPR